MNESPLSNYLHSHRKRSGLSQGQLGALLGYPDEGSVSRHERLRSIPPFQVALAYEAVFRVPVSDLFPGTYESVRQTVDGRIEGLRRSLQESSAKGRQAARTARILEWMWERENQDRINQPHVELA